MCSCSKVSQYIVKAVAEVSNKQVMSPFTFSVFLKGLNIILGHGEPDSFHQQLPQL